MEHNYYTIVLTDKEFGENLYIELSHLLYILFSAGYVCVVREEERGIIRVDFNYDVYKNFGNPIPIWCDEEELDILLNNDLEKSSCCGKCKDND